MSIREADMDNLFHQLEVAVSPTPFVPPPFSIEMLITVESNVTGAKSHFGVVQVPSRLPSRARRTWPVTLSSGAAQATLSAAVARGAAAYGSITYSGQPAANDTIVVNGHTFTYVAAAPTTDQILIGASLAATLVNAVAVLQASTDPLVQTGVYSASATVLNINYNQVGAAGNSFTLAKVGTTATVSGATLAGGTSVGAMALYTAAGGS